jgi:hypothetical protein
MFSKISWSNIRNLFFLSLIIVIQSLFPNYSICESVPSVYPTVLDVTAISIPNFTTVFQKITDLGTFTINSSNSIVEVTYNGRLQVESFNASTSGAVFELRIDDTPSTKGKARASVQTSEANLHVPLSITGIFTGLNTGNHTVSMWVRGAFGGGTRPRVNPGGWDDVVIIKEYRSLGLTYLPNISN